jgi:hypothetical protein
LSPQISRAGEWFLSSGIQETNGGVARYYRCDIERSLPISTEITGYAASAFVYLHSVTKDERYLERARGAAQFLARAAWNPAAATMPFELGPARFTYFFDCGIIVRGLLSAWRATGEQEFLDAAAAVGKSMARDFDAMQDFHPILALPEKVPVERDALRWSQSAGCYQLKAAMAWWDLAEATQDTEFRKPYLRVLDYSLRSYGGFLPGHPERLRVMDRLHAFVYFLEGLLPCAGEPRCAAAICDGIRRTAEFLRQIGPEFERSDVYAQLLRVRLYADWAGVAPLDEEAARFEAGRLAQFQADSSDPRMDGGFYFGRQGGSWLPYINPVSTAFAMQALHLSKAIGGQLRDGVAQPHRHLLI